MAAAAPPSHPPQPAAGLLRWTPTLPANVMSMFNPFGTDDPQKRPTEEVREKKRPLFATILPASASSGTPPSPSRSVMFAEPDSRSNSDNNSIRSSTPSQTGKSKRKSSNLKPKTCFSICHPPPASQTRQKLHRRPRSLLQLHRQSVGARPVPAFEVIPSANFSVRLTRAITRVFKAKHSLCPNDLVVLKAEDYEGEEDEEQDARDIIALICKGRKEDGTESKKSRICLHDGTEWEAYSAMKGGYEFFTTDEHGLGLTLRWVPKKSSKDDPKARAKFNFSTISPNSRKHPVIATLSKSSLSINDVYRMPDPKANTPLSTPLQDTFLADRMNEEDEEGLGDCNKEHCETDDRLRQIITVSAIWVAFKEGWSPTFRFDDEPKLGGLLRSPSLREIPSKNAISPVSTPPGSPGMTALEKRGSIRSIGSGMVRRGSILSRSNRTSVVSLHSTEETTNTEQPQPRTGRARGDSTSTVLVHRAASNRRKNHSQANWRPDLLQAPHQVLSETSREDLSSSDDSNDNDGSPSRALPTTKKSAQVDSDEGFVSSDQEPNFDKRESTATTETKDSMKSDASPMTKKLVVPATNTATAASSTGVSTKKPRKGLRRLFCFGGD